MPRHGTPLAVLGRRGCMAVAGALLCTRTDISYVKRLAPWLQGGCQSQFSRVDDTFTSSCSSWKSLSKSLTVAPSACASRSRVETCTSSTSPRSSLDMLPCRTCKDIPSKERIMTLRSTSARRWLLDAVPIVRTQDIPATILCAAMAGL